MIDISLYDLIFGLNVWRGGDWLFVIVYSDEFPYIVLPNMVGVKGAAWDLIEIFALWNFNLMGM